MSQSISTFNFPIAVKPADPRDSCRLLVLHRNSGKIEHLRFWDIGRYFQEGDVLVVNASAVFPARLPFWVGGIRGDALLLDRPNGAGSVRAKMERRSARRLNAAQGQVRFIDGSQGKALIKSFDRQEGIFWLDLEMPAPIEKIGEVPLPPYIVKARQAAGLAALSKEDIKTYQCVYADVAGSAACPTAGLHWTRDRIEQILNKGVRWRRVIHHVGLASIAHARGRQELPSEVREIEGETARVINEAKKNGRCVVACGTSTVRALESSLDGEGRVAGSRGATDLFVKPGFAFRAVDAMITNFHLPDSTNFLMTQAFAGNNCPLNEIYQEAANRGYQFYSYGDAMLIV
ncbi:MAG: S-adenosylmethionine:tRNA ribosyltransferase-isomerase [Elusimicrobia bacterium]|nr:S-adenosylmethionine:tRNA ribosyltransferase-isomerase [Elusimicrobiota bacterium]